MANYSLGTLKLENNFDFPSGETSAQHLNYNDGKMPRNSRAAHFKTNHERTDTINIKILIFLRPF